MLGAGRCALNRAPWPWPAPCEPADAEAPGVRSAVGCGTPGMSGAWGVAGGAARFPCALVRAAAGGAATRVRVGVGAAPVGLVPEGAGVVGAGDFRGGDVGAGDLRAGEVGAGGVGVGGVGVGETGEGEGRSRRASGARTRRLCGRCGRSGYLRARCRSARSAALLRACRLRRARCGSARRVVVAVQVVSLHQADQLGSVAGIGGVHAGERRREGVGIMGQGHGPLIRATAGEQPAVILDALRHAVIDAKRCDLRHGLPVDHLLRGLHVAACRATALDAEQVVVPGSQEALSPAGLVDGLGDRHGGGDPVLALGSHRTLGHGLDKGLLALGGGNR